MDDLTRFRLADVHTHVPASRPTPLRRWLALALAAERLLHASEQAIVSRDLHAFRTTRRAAVAKLEELVLALMLEAEREDAAEHAFDLPPNGRPTP